MYYYLYIDDIREDDTFYRSHMDMNQWEPIVVRNGWDAMDFIDAHSTDTIFVDLDYDLDCESEIECAPTGLQVCMHIVNMELPLYGFHIHSANRGGSELMRELLTEHGYKEVFQ